MKKSIIPVAVMVVASATVVPTASAIKPSRVPSGGVNGFTCETTAEQTYACKLTESTPASLTEGIEVSAGETLTIDLSGNGFAAGLYTAYPKVTVKNNGILIIKNSGARKFFGQMNSGSVVIEQGGNLTLENNVSLMVGENGITNYGTMTLKDAELDYETKPTPNPFTQAVIENHGTLNIENGEYAPRSDDSAPLFDNQGGIINIYGGLFKRKSDAEPYVAEGYEIKETAQPEHPGWFEIATKSATPPASDGGDNQGNTETAGSTESSATEATDENLDENPNTADPIALYVAIATVALLGLSATALFARKANR